MFSVHVIMLSLKIALVAEIVSESMQVSLIHCSIFVIALIEGVTFVPPRRKGISCMAMTNPAKAE